MGRRGYCRLERRLATDARRGRRSRDRSLVATQEACGCVSCACAIGSRVLAARSAEIAAENAAVERARKTCPQCSCTRSRRCVLALPDGAGVGLCVPAGELPGHVSCSGCLTPDLRVDAREWFWGGPIESAARAEIGGGG